MPVLRRASSAALSRSAAGLAPADPVALAAQPDSVNRAPPQCGHMVASAVRSTALQEPGTASAGSSKRAFCQLIDLTLFHKRPASRLLKAVIEGDVDRLLRMEIEMKSLSVLPLLIASAVVLAAPADAAILASGASTDPQLLTGFSTVGVRFRQLNTGSSSELYVGHSNLGVAANRSQADLSWAPANAFTISNSGGTLSATVGSVTSSFANVFNASGADPLQPFDTLQIGLRDGATGQGTFDLSGLALSGIDYRGRVISNAPLGGFAGVDGGLFRYFTVTGVDFRQDFTLTGTFNRAGTFGSTQEGNRVEFTIGNGPITQPVIPEPATWTMMIAGFAFVGAALRGRKASAAI